MSQKFNVCYDAKQNCFEVPVDKNRCLAAWHSGHRVCLQNRRSRVRIRQGLTFVGLNIHIAVLLSKLKMHYHCVYCSVNDRNRFIRRLFAKRKLTQTSHIVQYCRVPRGPGPFILPQDRGTMLTSLK
jgi:hypothetical protein